MSCVIVLETSVDRKFQLFKPLASCRYHAPLRIKGIGFDAYKWAGCPVKSSRSLPQTVLSPLASKLSPSQTRKMSVLVYGATVLLAVWIWNWIGPNSVRLFFYLMWLADSELGCCSFDISPLSAILYLSFLI